MRRLLVSVLLAMSAGSAWSQGNFLVGAARWTSRRPTSRRPATPRSSRPSTRSSTPPARGPRTTAHAAGSTRSRTPDTDGSGDFSYPLSSPPDGGVPVPEPFCDYNHNGRWDGIYVSGGIEEHAVRIHDPIDVRAIAFSDGSRTAVLASVVAQGIHENYTHDMRARARALTGDAQLETFVSANHNEARQIPSASTGPGGGGRHGSQPGIDEYYMDFVVEQVARAAKQAVDDLRPAALRVREFVLPPGSTFACPTTSPPRTTTARRLPSTPRYVSSRRATRAATPS